MQQNSRHHGSGRGKSRRIRARRAAVTVEFAIVAPLFFTFLFAGFEFNRANMIRNTLQNAAYEAARTGILPGATQAECVAAAQTVLNLVSIDNASVSVTPAALDASDTVTVNISAAMTDANLYFLPNFFFGKSMGCSLTLERES